MKSLSNVFKIAALILVICIVTGFIGMAISLILRIAVPVFLIYLSTQKLFQRKYVNTILLVVGILMLASLIF